MRSSRGAWHAVAVVVAVGAFAVTASLAVARSGGPGARTDDLASSDGSGQASAPAHSGTGAGHPRQPARCATAQVRISVRGGPPAEYTVVFTNVSRAACWLRGYPTVSGRGTAGQAFGVPAAGPVPASVTRVLLPPGASGHADVDASAPAPRVGSVHPGP